MASQKDERRACPAAVSAHMSAVPPGAGRAAAAAVTERFLAHLPALERYARKHFRHVRCADRREDAVAEVVAQCWARVVRAEERGKDLTAKIFVVASFCLRCVGAGRRLGGSEHLRDVFSLWSNVRGAFQVCGLPDLDEDTGDDWGRALWDHRQTGPAERAAFRVDFAEWLSHQTDRNRAVLAELLRGDRQRAIAERHGLSEGTIQQLRRRLAEDWIAFVGE